MQSQICQIILTTISDRSLVTPYNIPWLVFFLWLLLLIGVCKLLSGYYVRLNRKILYEACSPLSNQCLGLWEDLTKNFGEFNQLINDLRLCQSYQCSSSVFSGAVNNPLKYLMKYANFKDDINCVEKIDICIKFLTAREKFRSISHQLSEEIKNQLPFYIRIFVSKRKLPFVVCYIDDRFVEMKYPVFRFLYISPAGRKVRKFDIEITAEILKQIQSQISAKLTKEGHAKAQRNAMTNDLRKAIKKRDNYTCCICGNSVLNEPNLLLEVDHIIPVAKGGMTNANNLQTLCWRCNRNKSDK